MKRIYWRPVIFATIFTLCTQGCTSNEKKQSEKAITPADEYTCTMHPQILEDHPGKCPVCGMKLVKKSKREFSTTRVARGRLMQPTSDFVMTSLPVTTAAQANISFQLKSYGTIETDTRAAGSISSSVAGRIERLYLRYRYQKVAAGQKVMDIYSPELLTAQENLLFISKSDPRNTSFIQTAKQKLLLLGMSESDLNKVIATGKPLYSVGVYSKYGGHVHDAGMSDETNSREMNSASSLTKELALKEGMYVSKGQTLFMIMNHYKAWAAIDIFPNEQSVVRKGDLVKIIPETDTGATFVGTIDFIEPFFRSNSKSLTARIYFHNMDMLTIGSHVTANIYAHSDTGLWLPQSSVLSLGVNSIVFIKSKDGFAAHLISAGFRSDNKVQVLSGLTASDTVALNAQYLMDSETVIKPVSK